MALYRAKNGLDCEERRKSFIKFWKCNNGRVTGYYRPKGLKSSESSPFSPYPMIVALSNTDARHEGKQKISGPTPNGSARMFQPIHAGRNFRFHKSRWASPMMRI